MHALELLVLLRERRDNLVDGVVELLVELGVAAVAKALVVVERVDDRLVAVDRTLQLGERTVDGGLARLERAGETAHDLVGRGRGLGQERRAARERGRERRAELAGGGAGLAQEVVALVDGRGQRGHLVAQARERGVGRTDGAARRIDRVIHRLERHAHVLERVLGLFDGIRKAALRARRLVLEVDARLLGGLGHGLAHRRDEGRVERLLDGAGAGVGHLGRDGALLLVDVVGEFGLVELTVEHGQQILREVLGDDDGRVVLAALDALLGVLGGVDERPAQLVVVLELVDHLVAGVELADELVLGAGVAVGDGDLDALGVSVRIPVRHDVVPRVERRDDADTDRDHEGHGVHDQPLDIALEDRKGHLCIG